MITHSMILDDFFNAPDAVREVLIAQEMVDYSASDGVIYPGIVDTKMLLEEDIFKKLNQIYDDRVSNLTTFARFSFDHMKPPHWAHSDLNMTQYVGLIYLNPNPPAADGTHCVQHLETGLETHPETEEQMEILLKEGNEKDKWVKTYTCSAKYNRMFILNARYLHAAATKYGKTKEDARLVLTAFFNLD